MKYRIVSCSLEFSLITGCNCPLKPCPSLHPSVSFGFSRQRLPQWIFQLHFVSSSASSSVTSTTAVSSLTTSIDLLFGPSPFPLSWQLHPRHPSPNIPISFLRTCPNHLSLASRVLSPNHPTCAVPLMYSFLILIHPLANMPKQPSLHLLLTPAILNHVFICGL